MIVKSMFDNVAWQQVNLRFDKLTPDTKGLWGKMTVSQMLAHCKEAFKVPLSDKKQPRMFLGLLLGWMAKSKLYNDKPWGKNLPTAPNFIIKDDRNFETEKKALMKLVAAFYHAGEKGIGDKVHPFFGRLTAEQWGKAMWKHLDHHFKQFGV
jgi:Protein of unknown function (DUF1569)